MEERRNSHLWVLLLVAFLSAFPLRIEETFQWFRLKNLNLESCPSVRVERFLLKSMDSKLWRFWPFTLKDQYKLKKLIESREPLKVDTSIGWSSFTFKIAPLEMATAFCWDNRQWYLSKDGVVWASDHPLNKEYYGAMSEDRFQVTIDPSMPPVIEGEGPIYRFLYETSRFLGDVGGLFSQKWPGAVEAVRFYREGGNDLLSVYLKNKNNQFMTIILNKDWSNGLVGVLDLLNSGAVLKSGAVIDASYKDKIIVKDF